MTHGVDQTQQQPDRHGLQQEWIDADDQPHRVDDAVLAQLREVIGDPPADLEQTAPVVTRPGRSTGLRGRVVCEDGSERDLDDVVPADLPLGYHRLTTDDGTSRLLVVSPGRCFVPDEQRWGFAVQLYAAWSRHSAGLGDLGDLRRLREWTESLGGGFLVVNPLHAVAPVLPLEASPYLPATRRFRNPVYLDLDAVPGTQPTGRVPAAGTIDRDAAWTYKLPALRAAWDAGLGADDAEAFAAYRAEQGRALEELATWCLLATEHGPDFRGWPAELQDPTGEAVAACQAERADDVGFWAWLQWLLAVQLEQAAGDLTVIQDLPIGVSGGGADAWVWQDVLAGSVTVGAPPDALNTVGQDWGSPPLVPWRLRALDYGPFIESVRATIAGAGGLRIDHVMGLFRLWWIPEGRTSTDGCYVRYPADDLLDIVCLESHRAGAVVVGEDLGTVEDGVTEALAERGILGYRVLWFEDDDPTTWPTGSLAAVTTHDLPTVAGVWTGSDVVDQREASDMDPADIERGHEELLARLRAGGGGPDDEPLDDDATVEDALVSAHARLGRAASLLLAVSLDDAVAQERRPNVPGTTDRDNWRVPLPVPLDELHTDPRPALVLRALWSARPE
jgi:4-alpha-glucanotransferase